MHVILQLLRQSGVLGRQHVTGIDNGQFHFVSSLLIKTLSQRFLHIATLPKQNAKDTRYSQTYENSAKRSYLKTYFHNRLLYQKNRLTALLHGI